MASRLCPNMCEMGGMWNAGKRIYELCDVCSGFGVVDPDDPCACGAPSTVRKEGVAYCGRQVCHFDKSRAAREFGPGGFSQLLTHFDRSGL